MAKETKPKTIPDSIRTSAGFAKGERRRLARERKESGDVSPTRQITREKAWRFALPSRENILGTVDVRTRNHPELNDLLTDEDHRKTLIEFIDARIAAANGDRALFNEFINRTEPTSDTFDPQFALRADSLNTHFHIVLSCFPKKSN